MSGHAKMLYCRVPPSRWNGASRRKKFPGFRIVPVHECNPELVSTMKMHPAKDFSQALQIAEELLGKEGSITVTPEGISTSIN